MSVDQGKDVGVIMEMAQGRALGMETNMAPFQEMVINHLTTASQLVPVVVTLIPTQMDMVTATTTLQKGI